MDFWTHTGATATVVIPPKVIVVVDWLRDKLNRAKSMLTEKRIEIMFGIRYLALG